MEVKAIARALPLGRSLALAALFAALPCAHLGAWEEAATLLQLEGNVEVRRPGGAWEKAVEGGVFSGGTVISTGFESSATLSIGETCLTLSALGRLVIGEISVSIGEDGAVLEKVRLILQAGRLDALVLPPFSGETDWRVTSRFAAVKTRGAEFRFDQRTLVVWSGRAVFSGVPPQAVLVDHGETAFLDGLGFVVRRRFSGELFGVYGN